MAQPPDLKYSRFPTHNLTPIGMMLVLLVCLSSCQREKISSATKILYNGTIYTMDSTLSAATAVAISGDSIIAVGTLADVQAVAGLHATMIDLQGNYLIPGLIDTHNHAIKGGERLLTADVGDELLSGAALTEFAQQAMKSGKGMRGNGLYITGFHSGQWMNTALLDSVFNSAPYVDKPVFLLGTDGHTAWSNRALLELAGITPEFISTLPAEEASYYSRHENGKPNGFISEHAIQTVSRPLQPSPITPHAGATSGMKHLNSLGITAWLDPSAGNLSDGQENAYLAAYGWLEDNNELTAHVAATVVADANNPALPQILLLQQLRDRYARGNLAVLGFKIFADGVLEYPTQTAALSRPYKNSGAYGSLMINPEQMNAFVLQADQQGYVVHIHAIGDRAVSVSLDAIAAARNESHSSIPHAITHLQLVLPDDYPRFASLDVLPSMQLLWATADHYTLDLVKPYIDEFLFQHQYPAGSLLNAHATLCGASDWPVSSANPFLAMSVAETRIGNMGILNAAERVSRVAMLKAYTIQAARLLRLEKKIGSIETGKLADLVLVDRDVLHVDADTIKNTAVIWTMFAGNIVYEGGQ